MTAKKDLPYTDNLDAEDIKRIEALSELDVLDELWREYGASLGAAATGDDPIKLAKKKFKRRLSDIRGTLCSDPKIQSFLNDPVTAAKTDLALIFAGKLLEDQFGGVDVSAVSVLVAQIGLMKICKDELQL